MDKCRKLREEAAICRDLARETHDPASIAMFLDRAEQLETRAAAIEAGCSPQPGAMAPAGGLQRARLGAAEGTVVRTHAPWSK